MHNTEDLQSELMETLELWCTVIALKSDSPLTAKTYRKVVEPCLCYLHGQGITRLEQVEPKHLLAYLMERKDRVRPQTVLKDYRHLHAYFAWCVKQGLLERSPMEQVPRPHAPVEPKPALNREALQRLLHATEGKHWTRLRDRAVLLVLLDTGARLSEAYSLKVADLQGDSCLVKGKGSKWRTLYFTPETRIACHKYLKALPFRVRPESPAWWGMRGKPLTLHGFIDMLRAIGRRSGVKFSAHAIRRTFALECLRAGCDLERLRRLTGHCNLEVLRQHYLPLSQEDVRAAHQRYSPVNGLINRSKGGLG
ncbi:MAG: tyrosine recombinase XerD [Fimbriimonadales bacterium]|nr:MAG: tyrosine recombinase XerD [Fimbriimonadales bacterium]GIV10178.1 MAG: tyrosine recombinase XerD [Fimbriimonadales bacterium]